MWSVVISNYTKNTDGAYHRHNWDDWTAAQRERRDAFHDASWAEYFAQPKIPEGTVQLFIVDSLGFLWCGNAAYLGVTRDAGDGENLHGHPNDGDQ